MAVITQYNAPFKGMITDVPPIIVPRDACVLAQDFMYRNGYILSRPPLILLPNTDPPDNFPIQGICTSYQEQIAPFGTTYYILVFTIQDVYTYGGPNTALNLAFNLPVQGLIETFDYVNALASTLFVNGSQGVYQIIFHGGSSLTELTGGLYGAHFIMELAQTILIANTIEGTTAVNYPQRIRWCNAGNITQWDQNAFVGAGFTDLLDCSDVITGMFAMGSVGYVVRTNGITQVTPTGNGVQPWYFNHLWASQQGIGQVFPRTISQYGSLSFLLADDNVYTFTPSSINTVADVVINDIIADIAANNKNPSGPFFPYNGPGTFGGVFASLSPKYTVGYRQFCYKIIINNSSFDTLIIWSYDISNKAWTREQISPYLLEAQPSYVVSGGTLQAQENAVYEAFLIPTSNGLLQYDTTTNNTDVDNIYVFKAEQQQDLTYKSVGQVAIRYKNIDESLVEVTVNSPGGLQFQVLTLGDPTRTKAYYNGGTVPVAYRDGLSYVAIFSFHPVTDEFFQITVRRISGTGGLAIEQVTVFGESQEESR